MTDISSPPPGCTCHLEAAACVAPVCADVPPYGPTGKYEVYDAEGETVAICPSEDLASLVAFAINKACTVPGNCALCCVHGRVE